MTITKTAPTGKATVDSSSPTRKVLSFCLGVEEYGLDILAVREIIGLIDITPLPRTPTYVKGVINLRGKIIPVIALRERFGADAIEYTEEACIIVVDVPVESSAEPRQMGVVVDSVREVLDIPTSALEAAPNFGSRVPLDYIICIGKVKNSVVVILDAAKVMTTQEEVDLAAAASAGTHLAG